MRLAVTITMALSLVAGAAFAKTPYHDGTAEVIKPTDKNHPLGEIVSGYDFRKAMIRDVQDDDSVRAHPAQSALLFNDDAPHFLAHVSNTGLRCNGVRTAFGGFCTHVVDLELWRHGLVRAAKPHVDG